MKNTPPCKRSAGSSCVELIHGRALLFVHRSGERSYGYDNCVGTVLPILLQRNMMRPSTSLPMVDPDLDVVRHTFQGAAQIAGSQPGCAWRGRLGRCSAAWNSGSMWRSSLRRLSAEARQDLRRHCKFGGQWSQPILIRESTLWITITDHALRVVECHSGSNELVVQQQLQSVPNIYRRTFYGWGNSPSVVPNPLFELPKRDVAPTSDPHSALCDGDQDRLSYRPCRLIAFEHVGVHATQSGTAQS